MILKKRITIFFAVSLILLSGCGSAPSEQEKITEKFLIYGGQEYLVDVEYKVCNLTQPIIVFFPVITNKTITDTQFGGVGTKLKLSSGTATVKLANDTQEFLNDYYNGYYVSFLKYCVSIDNSNCLQAKDSIELCDTTIWVYHDSEFQTIKIADTYFRIFIVENDSEICLPDWNALTDNMKADIQSRI